MGQFTELENNNIQGHSNVPITEPVALNGTCSCFNWNQEKLGCFKWNKRKSGFFDQRTK
jgi:hypothetical protein